MALTTAINRLRYANPGNEDGPGECEKTFWLKSTLDRNVSGCMNFVVPGDYGAFTDVNATYLSVSLRVERLDGTKLTEDDKVFLSPGSLQSLFSSVQVSLNGAPLEPSNAYSYAATLTSYLGMSKNAREDVWSRLAGMNTPHFASSQILPTDAGAMYDKIMLMGKSAEVTLTGRLMSDFMQSCAQLLPPGVKLEVELRRQPDSFSLCSCSEDPNIAYKLEISSASLYVRRVQMSRSVTSRVLSDLSDGGFLSYTRLGCVVNQVPDTGVSYRVGNIFGGGPLPHTLYLVLVNQKAYSGSQVYLGNFFESGFVRSVQVLENGRPLLAQPMRMRYVYQENGYSLDILNSDATEPFLSVTQAINGIADAQTNTSMSYLDFVQGCIVYCVQLNSCGGTKVGPGFVDVELEIGESPHREPMNLLCFGEYDKTIKFDSNLNIVPH